MPRPKGSCFLMYVHDGIRQDLFDYLIDCIEDGIAKRIDLHIDRRLRCGENFKDFAKLINSVDSVIIIMTKQFKEKIQNREGGIYEEFLHVYSRLNEIEDNNYPITVVKEKFSIVPILFSGTKETSIPDEIKDLKYFDISHFHVSRNLQTKELTPPAPMKAAFSSIITEIVSQVVTNSIQNSDYFQLKETEYDDYFVDLKADFDRSVDGRDVIQSLFVKTRSYQKITNQEAYFGVGRKGCGKTTLAQVMPILNSSIYLFTVNINADDINLETMYQTFSGQRRYDIENFSFRARIFEFAWQSTLLQMMIWHLVEIYSPGIFPSDQPQIDVLRTYVDLLKESNYYMEPGWLYENNLNQVFEFLDVCIFKASDVTTRFFPDIKMFFNLESFLDYVIGNELLVAFRELISSMDGRVLFTFDGFDDAYDQFRRNTIVSRLPDGEQFQRTRFEIDWLSGLLSLVLKIKKSKTNSIYKKMDFCVLAPYDRFLEVVHYERDSYRTWSRWFTIQWTANELAILLRKRLEKLSGLVTDKEKDCKDRLKQILDSNDLFRKIPKEIEYIVQGQTKKNDLFLYILKYTFWRPRDLLRYYAKILALADSLQKYNVPFTNETIHSAISSTQRLVIEDEFINEFRTSIYNIEDIIFDFRGSNTILSFDELKKVIQTRDYIYATGLPPTSSVIEKIRFLYEIGFLGLYFENESDLPRGQFHKDIFYFNEGLSIFLDNHLSENDLSTHYFVIHPLFWDYLMLHTADSEDILNFSWEYLRKSEDAMLARI